MKKANIKKLTVSAMLIALATVLSLVTIWKMPLGGTVTLFSMLPICVIAIKYGTMFSVGPCLIYGLIQMAIGGIFGWGLMTEILIGSIIFDYLLAFGAMSLSGLFRKKGDAGIISGIILACVARFAFHFISGVIFFQCLDVFNNIFIYSLIYNGTFMLPELVLTVIGALAIIKVKHIKKLVLEND